MELAVRVAKAFVIASLTFASVWSMGGSTKVATVIALIPFVLGSLAIFSEFAYGLAGLTFIAAVAFQVAPQEWIDAGRQLTEQVRATALK